jgi:heme oxygenase
MQGHATAQDSVIAAGSRTPAFLERLRTATRARHEAIDASFPAGLSDGTTYRRYLASLMPLAELLAHARPGWPEACHALAEPRRAELLRADLDALSTPGAAAPRATSAHAWLGACYVMEGSVLGARRLVRDARRVAAADPAVAGAMRFLEHHVAGARRWPRFMALLGSLPEAAIPELVRGAQEAFDLVARRLAQREIAA